MSDWKQWLERRKAASEMSVETIPLDRVRDWGMQEDGERFARPDAKFFQLFGLNIQVGQPGQREVSSWDQPILVETGEGVCILTYRIDDEGEQYFLLSAKAEPGNRSGGCVLLAPTLQASKSNLERAHGGSGPPRADIYGIVEPGSWCSLPQDGGHFLGKRNSYAVVEVDETEIGALLPNERWFTLEEFEQAIRQGECNSHLVQCYAVCLLT